MEFTRRQVLKYGAGAGAALFLPWEIGTRAALRRLRRRRRLPGGDIPKYLLPLIVPPAMPRTAVLRTGGKNVDYYEIAVRQFVQQILPPSLPATTVWSYGSANHPATFNYPAFTIESRWRRPARVKWINDLKNPSTGNFLPHILPVDPTLHWANPPGGNAGRDERPDFSSTPGPYAGPVPIVTHLHGIEGVLQESDGYAEAWYLPAAGTSPPASRPPAPSTTRSSSPRRSGRLGAGHGRVRVPERAACDHALVPRPHARHDPPQRVRGAGRLLPAARRAGRRPEPPAAGAGARAGDPPGRSYYEIPLAIQDRSFNDDGSLFYPDSREFFDGFAGRTSATAAATSRRSGTRSSSATRCS